MTVSGSSSCRPPSSSWSGWASAPAFRRKSCGPTSWSQASWRHSRSRTDPLAGGRLAESADPAGGSVAGGTISVMVDSGGDLSAAYARAQELRERIEEASRAYYDRDTSLISDAEYDALVRELEELERAHPELQSQDSPTMQVQGTASSGLPTIEHLERMLSLDNVFSVEELRAWCAKTEAAAGRKVSWLSELKIDGLAVSLRYEKGVLTSAATRGDGRTGEVVTANALRMGAVPERLSGSGHPDVVEVRGEAFIPVEAFERLNALQEELR